MSLTSNKDNFDWSDTEKTRRALTSASVTTMIIANIVVTSSTIDVLGLTAEFDQSKMLALLQLLTSTLLLIFLLRIGLGYRLSLSEAHYRRKVEPIVADLDDFMTRHSAIDEPSNDRKKELEEEISYERERTEFKKIRIRNRWETLTRVVTDQAIPLCMAGIAIFHPKALAELAVHLFL